MESNVLDRLTTAKARQWLYSGATGTAAVVVNQQRRDGLLD